MEPVQGLKLNRRYISGLEPEMSVTVLCDLLCTILLTCITQKEVKLFHLLSCLMVRNYFAFLSSRILN